MESIGKVFLLVFRQFHFDFIKLCFHKVKSFDAVDPAEQDGVVYRIPCECGKVYIGETGRPMQDRIKEHDRDIRLASTETAVSEHAHNTGHKPLWNEVNLLILTPITTHARSKRQFIFYFTLTTSIGIVE